MDYQKFRADFESSGLTQVKYGELISMSSSMVCYYLKRAKRESTRQIAQQKDIVNFSSLKVLPSKGVDSCIRITTSAGLEIKIPV